MDFERRESLRATFEEVPELYDRVRPTYPPALFDDLVALAGLPERGRLLEIGTGPGKATVPLAERGFEIVGIELGERLAALARSNLAGFPNVEIVNAEFEAWEPAVAGFDAAVSFTAFHWIDPAARYEKTAALLREGGALAVVETSHVLPEDGDPFWIEVEDDYRDVFPDDEAGPPPAPDEVAGLSEEIAASGRFARPRGPAVRVGRDLLGRGLHRCPRDLLRPPRRRPRAQGAPLRANPPPHRGSARARGEEVVPRTDERRAAPGRS